MENSLPCMYERYCVLRGSGDSSWSKGEEQVREGGGQGRMGRGNIGMTP